MKFDWRDFDETKFENCKKDMETGDHIDDYIGAVRVGNLCFDLVLRGCDDTNGSILTYDLYVGGVDTGYGYKNDYPYDYDDGGSFKGIEEMDYHEFVTYAEKAMSEYIMESKYALADLVEKASEPLNIW